MVLVIKDINSECISKERDSFIQTMIDGQYQTWRVYVDKPRQEWEKVVMRRLVPGSNDLSFTLVAYDLNEETQEKIFIGNISVQRGCARFQDQDGLWVCGLYVINEQRRGGYAIFLIHAILEQLICHKIENVFIYTVKQELNNFYESLGFHVVEIRDVEGYPAVKRQGNVQRVLEELKKRLKQKNI